MLFKKNFVLSQGIFIYTLSEKMIYPATVLKTGYIIFSESVQSCASAMHLQCTCNSPAIHLHWTCNVLEMHLQCTYNTPSMHLQCTCNAHAMHLECNWYCLSIASISWCYKRHKDKKNRKRWRRWERKDKNFLLRPISRVAAGGNKSLFSWN